VNVLGPDDESAEVASGTELEQVDSAHVADVDSTQVSRGPLEVLVVVSVDHEGSLPQHVPRVSQLSLSGSGRLRTSHSLQVLVDSNCGQLSEQRLGRLGVQTLDHQRELGDSLNGVSSRHNQGSHG